ncbi:carboxymethylenebutenolidase [Sarracenia purpurea var. burkii]
METFVHQRDQYGNHLPGLYQFDVEVIDKGTNLFMPLADLSSKEVLPGTQLFSFSLEEPGNFMLMISDKEQSKFVVATSLLFCFLWFSSASSLKSYVSGDSDSRLTVILISDIVGYEAPKLRKPADKVASVGFYVVVPDFLYGDPYAPENAERPLPVWIKDHEPERS